MGKITEMARRRLEAEVEPILARYDRGLARYSEAVDVIGSINAEIKSADRWWSPLRCWDQVAAYQLTTKRAQHIGDVCNAVTLQLLRQ